MVGGRDCWEKRETGSSTKQLPSKLLILTYGWKSEIRDAYGFIIACSSLYYANAVNNLGDVFLSEFLGIGFVYRMRLDSE
jgi:hypothetical protein